MFDDETRKRLAEAFGAATPEQKAAFHRVCSGTPDEINDADLELMQPMLAQVEEALLQEAEAPRYTGEPVQKVKLTGCFFPHLGVRDGAVAPAFLLSQGRAPCLYLPCFSTIEKLVEMVASLGVGYAGVTQVEDEDAFLRDVPGTCDGLAVKIIIDACFTPDGVMRFKQVLRD